MRGPRWQEGAPGEGCLSGVDLTPCEVTVLVISHGARSTRRRALLSVPRRAGIVRPHLMALQDAAGGLVADVVLDLVAAR